MAGNPACPGEGRGVADTPQFLTLKGNPKSGS